MDYAQQIYERSADTAITATWIKDGGYHFQGDSSAVRSRCEDHGVWGYRIKDPSYHYKLHRCTTKPPVLYCLWNNTLLDSSLLAVVWPRKPSAYIQQILQDFAEKISSYNLVTISWAAQGVDHTAHRLSMDAAIPTIAVLWCGLRRAMKQRNRPFLQSIVDAWWLLLSERKLDQEATTYTFPQRNRIIAALADVVFVPGASKDSGSLITVDFALHYSTPVVTVPASVYDAWSAWSNTYLLENKIKGTNDVDAFLSQYFRKKEQQWLFQEAMQLSDTEQKMLHALQQWALNIAWLCAATELSVAEVMEQLLHLEIKHLVYCSEPWVYAKK